MIRAFVTAFGFLTRFPVPQVKSDGRSLGRSLMFFPVAGAAIGGCLTGLAGLSLLWVSPVVAAFVTVLLWAWVTGGLHLDGLADTFDGLSGGHGDRERTLTIMRDSRIGSHGTVALVLLLLGKVVLTSELLAADAATALWLVPTAARAAVVPVVAFFPSARNEGLGRDLKRNLRPGGVGVALLLAAGAFAPTRFLLWPCLAGAFGVALAWAALLTRRLGGLTGDVYGAVIEVSELAGLAGLLVTLDGPL
ncbi:MAG: adenosylcobinamide-GDP ribazoletransferase [Myxococcales bacterium]|nr:adenosylcobinamide-GDP ribazoletransferase [Myxococcales bacterium]